GGASRAPGGQPKASANSGTFATVPLMRAPTGACGGQQARLGPIVGADQAERLRKRSGLGGPGQIVEMAGAAVGLAGVPESEAQAARPPPVGVGIEDSRGDGRQAGILKSDAAVFGANAQRLPPPQYFVLEIRQPHL